VPVNKRSESAVMVELQIQRHTSSMVKQLTREKNCKPPIISKLVFAAVPQILTRRLFANHVSSAASPFLPSFHNFPAKLHNNLPELNGQAEPLTAHFDHRSQFRCQENAYIKAKPVLAVYGSPCDYRLARNDFHNCGFAASAGIQVKGSQSKRFLLSFNGRVNKKNISERKVLVRRRNCLLSFYPEGQLKVVHRRFLRSFTAHGQSKIQNQALKQPHLGAGRLLKMFTTQKIRRVDSNVSKTFLNWGLFLLALPHSPILTRPIPKKLSVLEPPTITANLLRRICSRFTDCLSSNKSRQ